MKKTLITLMALASCAMGVTLEDALLTSTGSDMNLDAEGMADSKDFTLTLVMDADAFVKTVATAAPNSTSSWIADIDVSRNNSQELHLGPAVVIASSSDKNNATLMGGYAGSDGKIRGVNFNVSYGTSTVNYISSLVSSAWGYDAETKTSDISVAVMTMTGTAGSNCSICLTLMKEDGTTILEYSGTTSGYSFGGVTDVNSITFNTDIVKNAYFFNNTTEIADIKTLHAGMLTVPEPATATLSLLALAGLAARRRRH